MSAPIMPGSEPFRHEAGPHGVLVLHGFTGSPQSMRSLAERLAATGLSVELPLLPGHGTSVEDMMETSWADWTEAALAAYDELSARCEKVAVCGLSMGGGLTAWIAARRPVAACVFINPIVTSPGAEMEVGIQALLDEGLEVIDAIGSDIKREGAEELSYPATPLACALSLFQGLADVEGGLERITAPSLLLSSREDHVVDSRNGDVLAERASGPVTRVWLEDSFHVATMDNDRELVEVRSVEFVAAELAR